MANSGAIFVSHSTTSLRMTCTSGMVLENGNLTYFDDIEAAIEAHETNMMGSQANRSKLVDPD